MEILHKALPSVVVIAAVITLLFIVHRLQERARASVAGNQFRNQVIMIALTAVGLLVIILVIPMGDTMRGQVLGLIGILLSAAIALSSTTVLGNAIAGFMLNAVRSFRMGDFIRAGDHFGRVSERGLFHTEIQTEDRDLTTIPNLYLVTHPVTTVRSSGTIVSATVSIGYDVSRGRVEKLLCQAAERAELTDPFVHVLDLGNFAVTYRIAGFLAEVKHLLSARSRLRKRILDSLHDERIEIASPNLMTSRTAQPDHLFIPAPSRTTTPESPESAPEDLLFDKAEEAESLETLRLAQRKLREVIKTTQELVKDAREEPLRNAAQKKLDALQYRLEHLEKIILEREAQNGQTG